MKSKRIKWDKYKCILCGGCVPVCSRDAIIIDDGKVKIDRKKCDLCKICVIVCPFDALFIKN